MTSQELKLCCVLNGKPVNSKCRCGYKLCKPCVKVIKGPVVKGRYEKVSKYFVGLNAITDAHFEWDPNCPRFNSPEVEWRDYLEEGLA